MPVTVAPPRSTDRQDSRDPGQRVDDLEALIEEARRRARRRRLRNASFALLGVTAAAVAIGLARGSVHTKLIAGSSVPSGAGAQKRSANGKLAFVVGTLLRARLELVNPDGSQRHVIAHCRRSHDGCTIAEPAWSPDGKQLAYVSGPFGMVEWPHGERGPRRSTLSLYVKDLASGAVRRLAGCGSCALLGQGHVSWSPDGSRIAFSRTRGPGPGETASLWIVNVTSGKLRRLTDCSPQPSCTDLDPAWSPNGHLIAFSRTANEGSAPYTIRPDGSQLTMIRDTAYSTASAQWSPDGQRIAYGDQVNLVVTNADGSHPKLLVTRTTRFGPGVPSWSPDGTKLAFFISSPLSDGYAVETMNADGSARNRVYHSVRGYPSVATPIWSPDGTKLAFAATSGPRNAGTFVLNADGTGLHTLIRSYADALTWQRLH